MNISVIGIWHLGSVTAACLADFGHNITCIDENKETIKNLKDGILPIYEPGLKNLTQKYNKAGTLKYSIILKIFLILILFGLLMIRLWIKMILLMLSM